VSLTLRNLELIPVNEIARFHMGVDGSGSAELAVSVRGKVSINALSIALLGFNSITV
jgi:filamin